MKKLLKSLGLLALMLVIPLAGHRAHKHYIYDYKGLSVVRLTGEFAGRSSGGTGFQVLGASGRQYTMTNNHVCMLADKNDLMMAEDYTGEKYALKIVDIYDDHDLCILEGLTHLPTLGVANMAIHHEQVHVIGHPRLEEITIQSASFVGQKKISLYMPRKLSRGCKNGKEMVQFGHLWAYGLTMCYEHLNTYHANLISYGGNSGSPVVDDLGRIIGVLFAGDRTAVTATYLVPLTHVKKFLSNY